MEGVDRLNELTDDVLVDNVVARLDCTTKQLIRTTARISKRWKSLWTQLPRLIFSQHVDNLDLRRYISYIDNTLSRCSTDLKLKKFKLDVNFNSRGKFTFKSRAKEWIRYAIRREVEDVDLRLWDEGRGKEFIYDDALFFDSSCFSRLKLTRCVLEPPNDVVSWGKLRFLVLSFVRLDERVIEIILSGSPCLEALELRDCYDYTRINITSKSVKKLVFSGYNSRHEIDADDDDYEDSVKINAPYISSLSIEKKLVLRELVLVDVSCLVEVKLDYMIEWTEFKTFEEVFRGHLKILRHVNVKDIAYGGHCLKLLSRLENSNT